MLKQTFFSRLEESKATDVDGVGRIRVGDDGKMYRYVKNAESATALTLGQVCCYTLSEGIDMFKSVKIPLTANLSLLAGVVMATDGIAAGEYGWIQVLGENASISAIGATTGGADVAAGSFMKPANAVAHLVYDTTSGAAAYRRQIQLLASIGTTTTPAAGYKAGVISCL